MKSFHITLAAGILAAAIVSIASAQSFRDILEPSQAVAKLAGLRDFNFLVGEWSVHHRKLRAGSHEWVEFYGTCSNRSLMKGWANMEEHILNQPMGAYRAIALRSYDSKAGEWAIWWLDGRYPSGPLDPPVKGRFETGVGTFYSDYMNNGKPMRLRFIWSRITPTSARWEQATSSDAGKTWDTNWIMEFQRASARSSQDVAKPTQAAASRTGPHDFDFLVGGWRVDHHYIRAATREWANTDGTCDNRPLMDGWANLEEHLMNAPGGAYRAIGLRAYDPKTEQWSIWWLDGRDPSGDIGPPVKGRFKNGVGTFFGDITLNGKPMRVRFNWSRITSASPRWEQAYSADAGKTWTTNWVMEFRRKAAAKASAGQAQSLADRSQVAVPR